jgi:hypothetical protein
LVARHLRTSGSIATLLARGFISQGGERGASAMVSSQRPSNRGVRPKSKTPAERADEFAAIQRRLKQEAAERRHSAAAGPKPPARAARRPMTPRRTP